MSDFAIRVRLSSANPLVAEGITKVLLESGQFKVLRECAADPPASDVPDVTLCIVQGGADLQSVVADAREFYPHTKLFCLFLTRDDPAIIAAIRLGVMGIAQDCFDDSFTGTDLVKGIKQVARGEFVLPTAVAVRLAQLHATGVSEAVGGRDGMLTPREQEVLNLLADGISNREIAARLCLSEHTVRAHLRGIMQKLQVTTRSQAVATAWKGNLVRSAARGNS